MFHVQQTDVGTIFTGSPLAENLEYVRVRIWLNSLREAVESVNTILNAELKGFDVSKQKDGPLRGFTSRLNVSKWTKTQNTTTSGSHIRDIYKSIYLYLYMRCSQNSLSQSLDNIHSTGNWNTFIHIYITIVIEIVNDFF